MEKTKTSYFYIYHDKIVIAPKFDGGNRAREMNENSIKNLSKEKLTGIISPATFKKVTNILTTWLNSIIQAKATQFKQFNSIRYYPIFVTLTLPSQQQHDDQFLRRYALSDFIKEVQNKYGIRYYFHRSESQKNGNIHFHLILDTYIPKEQIKAIWNGIMEKYGYMEPFFKKHNHKNPPSTHVKGLSDVNNFIEYVLKYVTKEETNRPVKGRIWGMSDELRDLRPYTDTIDWSINAEFKKYIDTHPKEVYYGEHFTVIFFSKDFETTELKQFVDKLTRPHFARIFKALYINIPEFKPPDKINF